MASELLATEEEVRGSSMMLLAEDGGMGEDADGTTMLLAFGADLNGMSMPHAEIGGTGDDVKGTSMFSRKSARSASRASNFASRAKPIAAGWGADGTVEICSDKPLTPAKPSVFFGDETSSTNASASSHSARPRRPAPGCSQPSS